jgi:hypothetical protein
MIDYALTTKTRVKERLQITTTSFDDVLERMIASATARIENITGRRFKSTTYTNELYDGSDEYGSPKMITITKNAPISSFGGFAYKSGANSNPSWVTVSQDNYDIALDSGIIYTTMPSGIQNIRMTYTAGYSIDWTNSFTTTHTLPFEITEVCERAVVKLFKKRDSEGRSQEGFAESSITWEKDYISPEDMTTLFGYTRNDYI